MEAVLFFGAAAVALAGALGVVLARNPVHAALALVLTMVTIAVFFVMQDAHLLAVIQIVVYASAIVVLFLFVIMLLGVDRTEDIDDRRPVQRWVALAVGAIVVLEVVVISGREWVTGAVREAGDPRALDPDTTGNVERVAEVLFKDFFWPFQVTAALLVIAVVGGVILARRSGADAAGSRAAVGRQGVDGAGGG